MVRNVDLGLEPAQVTAPQQLNQQTIGAVERQIDEAISQRAPLVELNMSGVQIVDSAALNWLLDIDTRLKNSNSGLRLVKLTALVEDILLATRLDGRLNIQPAEVVTEGGERNG